MLKDVSSEIVDAMFISDLHLHPEDSQITAKFMEFCSWAKGKTKKIYILGDFLHVWPGDDAIDAWSNKIIKSLAELVDFGIEVYFMPGNRDFLIGNKFIRYAKLKELIEPAIITLGNKKVLLVHGDRYCTKDKSHQRLRRFTRNKLFKLIFLRTSYKYRSKIVNKVRKYSANKPTTVSMDMLAVPDAISKHLRKLHLDTVIHGHTHIPGLTTHKDKFGIFMQYVLSDWDDNPSIMCYNKSNKLHYRLFWELDNG